jgi:pimeloyl-ACP methyl ester carboxylesterase
MMQKDFSFNVKGRTHDAIVIGKDLSVLPTFVLIHGGGAGSKERIHTYSEFLEDKGVNMLAFDQSGAGKDKDNILQSSLEQRTNESIYAIESFASKDPLVICGSSMGGEIALRLLRSFSVKSLILFCPAIYSDKAFSVKFGEGFTEIIREQDSWQQSAIFPYLKDFKGKLLIIVGELDSVIPPGVIEVLEKQSTNVSRKEVYKIPGCPHRYQEWLAEHPEELKKVCEKVAEYSM